VPLVPILPIRANARSDGTNVSPHVPAVPAGPIEPPPWAIRPVAVSVTVMPAGTARPVSCQLARFRLGLGRPSNVNVYRKGMGDGEGLGVGDGNDVGVGLGVGVTRGTLGVGVWSLRISGGSTLARINRLSVGATSVACDAARVSAVSFATPQPDPTVQMQRTDRYPTVLRNDKRHEDMPWICSPESRH